MFTLWEFQNGKMGQYRLKIDQDIAKDVKDEILINCVFVKQNTIS